MKTALVASLLVWPLATIQAQGPAKHWHLAEPYSIAVGTNNPEFGSVAGAVRLKGGIIVAADGVSLDLHVFSPKGTLLGTAGRKGAGPGEFRTIRSVRRCGGDSVFVYDPALFRISVFSPRGTYKRAIDIRTHSADGLPPYDFWCNPAGILAFVHRSNAPPEGIGPRRPQVAITTTTASGGVVTVGSFPGSDRYFNGINDYPQPLGRETSVVVGANKVYVGTGDAYEVATFSLEGVPGDHLREVRPSIPVTGSQVDEYIRQSVASRARRGAAAGLEKFYRGIKYPDAYPAYARLMVDGDDNLWIESFPVPGKATREWTVYSNTGVKLASLTVASNFRLLEAGSDYVLGVWRDESDEEHVRVYTLMK